MLRWLAGIPSSVEAAVTTSTPFGMPAVSMLMRATFDEPFSRTKARAYSGSCTPTRTWLPSIGNISLGAVMSTLAALMKMMWQEVHSLADPVQTRLDKI